MTKDEFSRRYRSLEQLTSGKTASYRAQDSAGDPVMLHMFGDANMTTEAVVSILADLAPDESAKVREVIEVDGTVVAVTAEIAPFASLDAWIAASVDQEPAPPAAEPGPAAASDEPGPADASDEPGPADSSQPGELTRILRGLDSPLASPAPEPLPEPEQAPATPPAPARPKTSPVLPPRERTGGGQPTRLFAALDPEQLSGSSPLSPSSKDVATPPMAPTERPVEPPSPLPPPPEAPGTFTQILRGGDLVPGPPPVEPPQVASPDPGGVNPLSPASPSATPSLPDTYNLEGTPPDSQSRAPDATPASSPVKPLEDPAAPAEPGNMLNPAPDYRDRLRTPPQPPVVQPPAGPPAPRPGTASASAYTMVIKGATPPTAPEPVAPVPQPPPPAAAQPQPARRSSRVPLIIGGVLIVAILIALLVFLVLGGGGGAADTG